MALISVILLVASAFCIASWMSGSLSRREPAGLATNFAHSLVPIATGYLIAHYFSLLVFAGQQAFINASDPLSNGSNWFGLADRAVDYNVVSVQAIAVIQVSAIVTGHVLGVFAAHDRAVRIFPHRQALVGQVPMMVLMIGYTFGGLSLLFAG